LKAEVIVELNGKEIYRGKSDSFVVNLAKALYIALYSSRAGANTTTTVTAPTGGGAYVYGFNWPGPSQAQYAGGVWLAMNAPDNDDSYGIWVGSGSAAVSPGDYNLASKIPHGTGAGQLDYEPHTITSSYSGTSSYVEIARSFVNKSGGDVIVREVGLLARNYWKYSGAVTNDAKFLIARDVLPNPILVPNLASLTVRYRISLSL